MLVEVDGPLNGPLICPWRDRVWPRERWLCVPSPAPQPSGGETGLALGAPFLPDLRVQGRHLGLTVSQQLVSATEQCPKRGRGWLCGSLIMLMGRDTCAGFFS